MPPPIQPLKLCALPQLPATKCLPHMNCPKSMQAMSVCACAPRHVSGTCNAQKNHDLGGQHTKKLNNPQQLGENGQRTVRQHGEVPDMKSVSRLSCALREAG
eukprot:14648224-Alexandrium_andersonii.AAC.1